MKKIIALSILILVVTAGCGNSGKTEGVKEQNTGVSEINTPEVQAGGDKKADVPVTQPPGNNDVREQGLSESAEKAKSIVIRGYKARPVEGSTYSTDEYGLVTIEYGGMDKKGSHIVVLKSLNTGESFIWCYVNIEKSTLKSMPHPDRE